MKDKEYDKQFNQMLQRRQGKDVIKNIEERYKDLGEGEGEGEAQELYEADGLDSNDDDIEPPKLDDPKVNYIISNGRSGELIVLEEKNKIQP